MSCKTKTVEETETILFNGTIYTLNPNQPQVEAVAIAGDKIIAIGDLIDVKSKVSKNAIGIDLNGKFLLPGLIDSHNHAIKGGERLLTAHLDDGLLPRDELAAFADDAIKTGKGTRGDGLYITGLHSGLWSKIYSLDSLFNTPPYKEIPVLLLGTDGHTAWCNATLLQRAGVDKKFLKTLREDERAYFATKENGEPNGFISEEAIKKVDAALPPSNVTAYDGALSGVEYLNSLGITAWLDPSTGNTSEGVNNEKLNAYGKLSKDKHLTAHVASTIVADVDGDMHAQLVLIKNLQEQFPKIENVNVIGFKIFADGVLEFPTQTAAISIPYTNSGKRGSLRVDPEKLKTFVTLADANHLLVHIHAIGDRAVSESLNAFAAARRENKIATSPTPSLTYNLWFQLISPGLLNFIYCRACNCFGLPLIHTPLT